MEVYTLVEGISLEIKKILRLREALPKIKSCIVQMGRGVRKLFDNKHPISKHSYVFSCIYFSTKPGTIKQTEEKN